MPITFDWDDVGPQAAFAGGSLNFSSGGVSFTFSNPGISSFSEIGGGASIAPLNNLTMSNSAGFTQIFTLTFTKAMSGDVIADVAGTGGFTWITAGGTATGTDNVAFNGGVVTGIRFYVGVENLRLDTLTANVACFLAGTEIATPSGTTRIEDLQPGDRIRTADGGETSVKWLGTQQIAPRFRRPEEINPICITAGAIAENTPARDLFLSGDHAVAIDGVLYNAGALVNGDTIYQVAKMPLDGFTYYHVETDGHELMLAEGLAAETYLDADWQAGFDNTADRDASTTIPEMDLRRITSARLVPEAVKTRIAGAAGAKRAA